MDAPGPLPEQAVSPAQMVQALGQACRLAGLADRHAKAVALGRRVTPGDVVALLGDLLATVDRQRPIRDRRTPPTDAERNAMLALVAEGLHDHEIAERMGATTTMVRRIRRAAGLPGNPKPPSGWQERIRDAHARGLTDDQIAEATGYTVGTVQQYRWILRLPANPKPKP